jgi:HSP20 family molecular chaperone IbpA
VELSVSDKFSHRERGIHPFAPNMKIVQAEGMPENFERAISLPESIAPQGKITARFENGLLEIGIPRVQRPREEIKID